MKKFNIEQLSSILIGGALCLLSCYFAYRYGDLGISSVSLLEFWFPLTIALLLLLLISRIDFALLYAPITKLGGNWRFATPGIVYLSSLYPVMIMIELSEAGANFGFQGSCPASEMWNLLNHASTQNCPLTWHPILYTYMIGAFLLFFMLAPTSKPNVTDR